MKKLSSFSFNFCKQQFFPWTFNVVYDILMFNLTRYKIFQVTGANKGVGFAAVRGLCKQFDGDVYLTGKSVS